MSEIHKIEKNGVTIYPATTTDAVVDATERMTVREQISELRSLFTIVGAITNEGYNGSIDSFLTTDFLLLPENGLTIRGYDGASSYNYRVCAFYDNDKQYISSYTTGETEAGIREVVINNYPENAMYFRASTQLSRLLESYVKYGLGNIVTHVGKEFNALHDKVNDIEGNVDILTGGLFVDKELELMTTENEEGYISESKAISHEYKLINTSAANLYVVKCPIGAILEVDNLSNVDQQTKCWAVYNDDGISEGNVLIEYSDTGTGLRTGVSVMLQLPKGTIAVFSRNKNQAEPSIKKSSIEIIDQVEKGDEVYEHFHKTEDYTELEEQEGFYRTSTEEGGTPTFVKANGTGWRISTPIPIALGDVLTTTSNAGIIGADYVTAVTLDKDKTPLLAITLNSTSPLEITQDLIEKGSSYVVVSYRPADDKKTTVSGLYNYQKTLDRIKTLEENKVEPQTNDYHFDNKNAYKGIAPIPFKKKLLASEQDINIILLGDSVTALTNVGEELEDAPNLPAGCQHNSITFQLWNYLCKNKQQCDRFDSKINPFTENGTFIESDVSKQNGLPTNGNYGEFSQDNCLYRETSTPNDSFSFTWNLDDFEKLNVIGRMSIYGSKNIEITCPTGKILVQHNNRANPKDNIDDNVWTEANGYAFTQFLNCNSSDYNAWYIRNFPIKFKRVEGATGTITITFTNKCNSDDVNEGRPEIPSTTMYYWGTERWNHTTVRITNCARAGRTTDLLSRSIKQELTYRDTDLVIWQLPLWNELKAGGDCVPDICASHDSMINNFKIYSETFAKFQVIVNMVHTQLASWKGNKNIQFQANGLSDRPKTNLTDWECCSKIFLNILNNADYSAEKLVATNLYNEVYNYAQANGLTMEQLLDSEADTDIGDGTSSSGKDSERFTVDGTHPSSYGFSVYSAMIAPMMY